MGAIIIGSGKAIPKLVVENDELKALVETDDEWINSRTGISERRISVDETGLALAERAAASAMGIECESDVEGCGWNKNAIDPATIDLVIYSSVTADTIVPSCAAIIKRTLGMSNAIAFDINAACTGFIYGLSIAESMLAASNDSSNPGGRCAIKRALVIGSDRLSRITDWRDRNTCVLFGDGAGAAVIEWQDPLPGIMATYLKNDDDTSNALTCMNYIEAPQPFTANGIDAEISSDDAQMHTEREIGIFDAVAEGGMKQVIRMDGRSIFKFATNSMDKAILEVLDKAGKTLDDIDLIVPHQANERIIKFAAKKLGVPLDKFQLSIAGNGNTSSASVPMALADAYASGRIEPGSLVVLVAFGGGLTSGAVLFEA